MADDLAARRQHDPFAHAENVKHLDEARAKHFLRELKDKPFVAVVGGTVYISRLTDEQVRDLLSNALYDVDPNAFDP